MPRKPVRNWYLLSEVASLLGISGSYAREMYLRGYFPNADKARSIILVPKTDIEKIQRLRVKQGVK